MYDLIDRDQKVSTGALGDDGGKAKIVEWLHKQPVGAVIRWTDADFGSDRGRHTSWVDVEVPELMEECGLNWVWTVDAPVDDLDDEERQPGDEEPTSDQTVISVARDVDVWGVWDRPSR